MYNEKSAVELAKFYAHAIERNLNCNLVENLLPITRQLVQMGELFEKAKLEADYDALTGLVKRPKLFHALEIELERTQRKGTLTTVLMMDLDNFGKINNEHGHIAGDEVLSATANVVKEIARATDTAGRYGGEEFMVVLSDCSDPMVVAEKIRSSIANLKFDTTTGIIKPTISIGVASWDGQGMKPLELVDRADKALLSAKATGKNAVVVWNIFND